MNRWQKIAWYNIIVIVSVLTITAGTITILYLKVGFPKARAGLGLLGFMGLLGLSVVFFRKTPDRVNYDERDMLIHYRSVVAAYAIFWPAFTAACMVPWFILGPKTSLPITVLPMMLGGFGIFLVLVQSVAALIQYRRGGKDGQK